MCVIMYGKVRNILKLDLESVWKANKDGAGVVFPASKPEVIKGLMTFDDLIAAISMFPVKRRICVHFRFGTHGADNAENTHPFQIGENSYLMHNGVIPGLAERGKGKSDTAIFSEILAKLPHNDQVALLQLISSKYLICNKEQVSLIGNFTAKNKVMCSNLSWTFQPASVHYTGCGQKSYGGHRSNWPNRYDDEYAESNRPHYLADKRWCRFKREWVPIENEVVKSDPVVNRVTMDAMGRVCVVSEPPKLKEYPVITDLPSLEVPVTIQPGSAPVVLPVVPATIDVPKPKLFGFASVLRRAGRIVSAKPVFNPSIAIDIDTGQVIQVEPSNGVEADLDGAYGGCHIV